MRRTSCFVLAATLACSAAADDKALAALHGALVPLRTAAARNYELPGFWTYDGSDKRMRYAMPAAIPIRRMLRDWIETQLATAPENVRERSFAARLNLALGRADLFCRQNRVDDAPDRCDGGKDGWNALGFVNPDIAVDRPVPSVLVIRAGLGIECGTDTSAYAYEWRNDRWQRFWQYEQPIGKRIPYFPQSIDVVSVSEPDARGARHVMTLGNMDWCSSSYYPVYVRLWRATPGEGSPKLLLDRADAAWLAGGDPLTPPITGRVTLSEAYFEFARNTRLSLENPSVSVHYSIRGDTLTRVDPLATDPGAFVLEWLDESWSQSRRWITANPAKLEPWHQVLKSGRYYVEYPAIHACRDQPSIWQVTLDLKSAGAESVGLHVLVERQSPDRFVVRDIRSTPRTDCDGPAFAATIAAE